MENTFLLMHLLDGYLTRKSPLFDNITFLPIPQISEVFISAFIIIHSRARGATNIKRNDIQNLLLLQPKMQQEAL